MDTEQQDLSSFHDRHPFARRRCRAPGRDPAKQPLRPRFRGTRRRRHRGPSRRLRRSLRRRGPGRTAGGGWRSRLGRPDPSGQDARGARSAAARDRDARPMGERTSRRHSEDGRQGGALPDASTELGRRHASLRQRRRLPHRIPVAPSSGRPTRTQAEPRERRPRRLESGSRAEYAQRRFGCSTRSAAVDPRRCRSTLSLPAASRISDGAAASSIRRSSLACPKE